MSDKRELKKKEGMMISKILDELNFKHYAEYLISTKFKDLFKNMDFENKKFNINKNETAVISLTVLFDVFTFVYQNVYKAEEDFDKLVSSYINVDLQSVEELTWNEYLDILKDIFISAVPSIIRDYVDLSDFKKKLNV